MTLRKTFRPKREEVTGKWRKLHIEALHNLHSSPDAAWVIKSRRMRWAGNVAKTEEKHKADRLVVGKPEGKRPLGRPRSSYKDNVKMDLKWENIWLRTGPSGGLLRFRKS